MLFLLREEKKVWGCYFEQLGTNPSFVLLSGTEEMVIHIVDATDKCKIHQKKKTSGMFRIVGSRKHM